MSDEAGQNATVAADADDAVQSAAGLRDTARWMAAAFGGVPSLAIFASLVRAPGDAGFQNGYLIAGVLLASLGALVGILGFAAVFAPAGLVDSSIDAEVMNRLPEARYKTYADLRTALETTRDVVGDQRVLASDSAGWAEAAEAAAVQAEATVKLLEEIAGIDEPRDETKQQEAQVARQDARRMRAAAGTARGEASIRARELALNEQILASLEQLRRAAYQLQAGRVVTNAYMHSKKWAGLSVALVAIGVIFLALAPRPKPETAVAPELVSLRLTPAGQAALNCSAKKVAALKVGGDDRTATIIVLPGSGCPIRTVQFITTDPEPFGKVTKPEVITAK